MPGRLVILTGPSCAGKSPLHRAMARTHPRLHAQMRPVVLYNDRAPRPGEADGVDYHFRPRKDVEALRDEPERYVVQQVRNDLLALDLQELRDMLRGGDALFEGNPAFGATLIDHPALAEVERLSIFIAPVTRTEMRRLVEAGDARHAITDLMRQKLTRRTQAQKGQLARADLDDIATRAAAAYDELKLACRCDHVVPNHDGEDSDHWRARGEPVGDARLALQSVVALIRGGDPPRAENWPEGLVVG